MSPDACLCDAIRTPFGRSGGALSSVRADDLGAVPLAALMALASQLKAVAAQKAGTFDTEIVAVTQACRLASWAWGRRRRRARCWN
jgi:acetyl-CoA acetyltransferase